MYSLAIARFDIPGEAGFPLNGNYIFIVIIHIMIIFVNFKFLLFIFLGVYARPRTPDEADSLRQYFLQLR